MKAVTARGGAPALREGVDGSALDAPESGQAALRGGAVRSAGYVLGLLLSLVAAPLLIRHLGVVDFGRYTTVVTLAILIGGATEAGLNVIALREYSTRSAAERSWIMRNLIGVRLTLTAAGVALGVAFALVAGYDSVMVIGVVATGAGLMMQALQTLLSMVLQGELRFGWITAVDLLRQLATVVLIVALVLAGSKLGTFFWVSIPAGAIALAPTIWLVRRLIPLRPAFHRATWWPLVRDMLPYAAAVALNVLYFRVTLIAMSLLDPGVETGYFATSYRVIEVLIGIPALLIGAAFPILARSAQRDEERFQAASVRILELALLVGAFVAICLVLGAQTIIDVLAGRTSQPSVPVLRLQGLAVAATFVATAAGFALLALHRHRAILFANAIALVAAVGLTLGLVGVWHARGAAVATVVAEAALAVASVAYLRTALPATGHAFRTLPPVLVAAGAACLVLLVPGVPALGDLLLGAGAYLLLIALFGRFPPEARELVRLGYRASGDR